MGCDNRIRGLKPSSTLSRHSVTDYASEAAAIHPSGSTVTLLLTNAIRLLSGDQEGTFIVPWPP